MKAEQQAKEIIESFYPFVEGIDVGERHRAAIQCGLLQVNGILDYIDRMNGTNIFKQDGIKLSKENWQKVKSELEKQ